MIPVGTLVRLLPPFEDGHEATTFTVEAVQFVAEDGTISEQPTERVQYLVSGGCLDGVAFASQNLEAIP